MFDEPTFTPVVAPTELVAAPEAVETKPAEETPADKQTTYSQ
jgi:hypothetical protein